ncbi:cysteine-rich CWC family protein [uncultured Methylophaga sp.]|uniref:cysteine-rich CWC family protein n=1 Tax=uncultured Methylophaga sp. TaxID=285271 RepID=UPI00338EA1B9
MASVCKHEPVACPRCGDEFVCKPGAVPICHCFEVKLSKEQREWIAERWEGCLCGSCLHTVAEEF